MCRDQTFASEEEEEDEILSVVWYDTEVVAWRVVSE
jgi:hypothetical protein